MRCRFNGTVCSNRFLARGSAMFWALVLFTLLLAGCSQAAPPALTVHDETERLDQQRIADAAAPLLARGASVAVIVVDQGDDRGDDLLRRLSADGLTTGGDISAPLLAVCVGEQMLFELSEEGQTPGLGVFDGSVVRFAARMEGADGAPLKVPHMGWNRVRQSKPHALWDGVDDQSWFYFVHSYYVRPRDSALVAGETMYGEVFTCAVARDNIFATQFHPEKSAAAGLRIYENFTRWNP